jgi:hypothetical protein
VQVAATAKAKEAYPHLYDGRVEAGIKRGQGKASSPKVTSDAIIHAIADKVGALSR